MSKDVTPGRLQAHEARADLGAVPVTEQAPADQLGFGRGQQARRDGLAESGLQGGSQPDGRQVTAQRATSSPVRISRVPATTSAGSPPAEGAARSIR